MPDNIHRGPVRNNGGGHWNHSFCFGNCSHPRPAAPFYTGKLGDAINATFGSFADFQVQV